MYMRLYLHLRLTDMLRHVNVHAPLSPSPSESINDLLVPKRLCRHGLSLTQHNSLLVQQMVVITMLLLVPLLLLLLLLPLIS